MKLLIKIPTRRGTAWLENWLPYITEDSTKILISADDDQHTSSFEASWGWFVVGKRVNKIEAINRDVSEYIAGFDSVLVAGDDHKPVASGFDHQINELMRHYYPTTNGILWLNDHPRQRNHICTLPVVGKAYYMSKGYIYHPSYKSLFCDNEMTAVAKQERKITYIKQEIVKHYHPAWNKEHASSVSYDTLYEQNDKDVRADQQNWNTRKKSILKCGGCGR